MKKVLKFWYLTILMVMCVGLSSCIEDDFGSGDDSIVGLWTFVNLTAEIEHPIKSKASEAKAGLPLVSLLLQGTTIEFKANKTFIFSADKSVGVGFFGDEDGTGTVTGTYQKKSNNIFTATVTDDEGTYSTDITLKNGILSLISDESDDEDYKEEGFTKYVVIMNFKKSS